MITRHLRGRVGRSVEGADDSDSGALTLIQRFGSAANLNIHLHRLVLDGAYRRCTDGAPELVELPAPTEKVLQAQLRTIITRTMEDRFILREFFAFRASLRAASSLRRLVLRY